MATGSGPISKIIADDDEMTVLELDGELTPKKGRETAIPIVAKFEQARSTHLLEYYRPFLNVCYFLLIVPFRLVKVNGRNGNLNIYAHSNRVQKLLCAVVQSLILYEYFSMFRLFSWDDTDGTPLSYLLVATVFASFLYVLAFMYVFWTKVKIFQNMFQDMQNLEFAYNASKRSGLKIHLVSTLLCIFAITVAMTDPMIHDGLLTKESFENILKKVGCRARSYYLFKTCPSHLPDSELPVNESFLDYFVTYAHLVICLPNLIMVHIVDVAVVLTAICMWHVLTYFIQDSKLETTSSQKALLNYEILKELVKNTNSAVGLLTFSAIAVSLPFYASWGAIVFNDNAVDWLYLIHVSAYFLNFFTILTFGADFNFKIDQFYSRISVPEVCEGISPNRLTALLMDMKSSKISIRGCGFFVITYKFFGTILSLIATYSIIILQFQFSRRNMSHTNVNCTYLKIGPGLLSAVQ